MSTATAPLITAPGLYDGIPAAAYHADPCPEPSLSSSILRTIVDRSIAHAHCEHPRLGGNARETTPAMGLGTIVHSLIAGDSSDCELGEYDSFRSAAARQWRDSVEATGRRALLRRDLEDAEPIVAAIRSHAGRGVTNDPFAPHGRSEVTAVWQEGPIWCRARYDRLVCEPTGYADIWDWKTTNDITERGILRSIVSLGYHVQAAFYLRGLATLMPEYAGRMSFVFVFAETAPPYLVRRVVLSPSFLRIAERALSDGMARWARALATGDFAPDDWDTLTIEPPAYLEDDEITLT